MVYYKKWREKMNFYNWLKSFTLYERKKKQLKNFSETKKSLERLSEDELLFVYVNTKALFEHKSKVFSFFLATILLSVLTGLWKEIYFIFLKCTELIVKGTKVELAYMTFLIFGITFLVICSTIVISFMLYLNSIYQLNKKLILIEKVLDKK